MRVCVGTIIHHPEDARIMHRQIRALLDAGHEITYVAPFTDCNVTPIPGIRAIDVPRALGAHRGRALRAVRGALRRGAEDADLLLVCDLASLLRLPRRRPVTVWDVRDDAAGPRAAGPFPGLPHRLPRPLLRLAESRAERRVHLILADESLRERFELSHPVVPGAARVPGRPPRPPAGARVVHLGRLRADGGVAELVELARRLAPYGIRTDLIGEADPEVRPAVRDAQRAGLLDWYGHVPDRHATRMAEGALAGLSLPRDLPGAGRAMPVEVVEYMARGLPVITTPAPAAAAAVERTGCGVVVPFGDVDAALRAVLTLRDDPGRAADMGARGYREALHRHDWADHSGGFVELLEGWAAAGAAPAPARPHPLPA
ncbi:glycosyltransferase [Streptosporangium sp. NPDC004379]|uniref:glycosyltransferase n=1 Tax=Streptosporangium sp. NPDC004379 TaxID=3366189 RepID=UPI0036969661